MFQYHPDTQTYSMSLFESAAEEPFSAIDERHKQLQEVALRSTFKVITEAPFHDLWFCEANECENSFWFGGKHHCRMCGKTVCEEHCYTNIVLSTHLMPVVVDKLPNITQPILAASRTELPETLEFKRACLNCCERAKDVPRKLKAEEEKQRRIMEEKKRQEAERLAESHWSADAELASKIHAMKTKKISWSRAAERRRRQQNEDQHQQLPRQQDSLPLQQDNTPPQPEPLQPPPPQSAEHTQRPEPRRGLLYQRVDADSHNSEPGRAYTWHATPRATPIAPPAAPVLPTKTGLTQQMAERAERRLRAAKSIQEAALEAHRHRRAILDEQDERLTHQREEFMSPAELALYRKQQERARAQQEKEAAQLMVDGANQQMRVGLASVFFGIAKRAEIEKQQEELRVVQEEANAALCQSSRHIFDRITLNKELKAAQSSGDEVAKQLVAVAMIAHTWRRRVDRRKRMALKVRREKMRQTVALARLQTWWRMMLAKLRTAAVQKLKKALNRSEEEITRIRVLDLLQVTNLSGIRRVVYRLLGLVRLRLKMAQLPRVLVVEQVVTTAPAAQQSLLVHLQSGLDNLTTVHASGRALALNRSVSESIYKSRAISAAEEGKFTERCLLTHVPVNGVIGVALINPDSYSQTLISLAKYPDLIMGKSVIVTKLPIETATCPVLNAAKKSELPAKSNKARNSNSAPSLASLSLRMLPLVNTMAGRVLKQANSVMGEFKTRYLVLAEGRLCYYDDRLQLHKPRGMVRCEKITALSFGPDRSPGDEPTLHIVGPAVSWFLRFPKSAHKGSVSAWLRKLQYACPQVTLNNSQKPFLARIEQMSKLYSFPVLRPADHVGQNKGFFGSFSSSNDWKTPESTSAPKKSRFSMSFHFGSTGSASASATPRTPVTPVPVSPSGAKTGPGQGDSPRSQTSTAAPMLPGVAAVGAPVPVPVAVSGLPSRTPAAATFHLTPLVLPSSVAASVHPTQVGRSDQIRRASEYSLQSPGSPTSPSRCPPVKASKPAALRRASESYSPSRTWNSTEKVEVSAQLTPPAKNPKPASLRRASESVALSDHVMVNSKVTDEGVACGSAECSSALATDAVTEPLDDCTDLMPTGSQQAEVTVPPTQKDLSATYSPSSAPAPVDSETPLLAALSSDESTVPQLLETPASPKLSIYQPKENPLLSPRRSSRTNLTATSSVVPVADVMPAPPVERVYWSDDSDIEDTTEVVQDRVVETVCAVAVQESSAVGATMAVVTPTRTTAPSTTNTTAGTINKLTTSHSGPVPMEVDENEEEDTLAVLPKSALVGVGGAESAQDYVPVGEVVENEDPENAGDGDYENNYAAVAVADHVEAEQSFGAHARLEVEATAGALASGLRQAIKKGSSGGGSKKKKKGKN